MPPGRKRPDRRVAAHRRQPGGKNRLRTKYARPGVKDLQRVAKSRLRRFRQGSALAVSLTALILLIWGGDQTTRAQEADLVSVDEETQQVLSENPVESLEQAADTVRDLVFGFYGMVPRILIAVIFILLAVAIGKAARSLLQRSLGHWERTNALATITQIIIILLATAAALSVLAGDARALFGSIGLVGLALSWALQTPIESFTGWLINSFRSYYRIGDRIEVGDVFGDVYKIDVLTTTVWEAGGPGKPVAGAQATGAMITFPNWEVLRSNIINYSRDFPYVWDEITVGVANESDLRHTVETFERVSKQLLGAKMSEPAQEYRALLAQAKLAFDVEDEPKAFISLAEAWTNCTVRYLVPARSRRRWASELIMALTEECAKPEHHGKIINGYPRQEVRLFDDTSATSHT